MTGGPPFSPGIYLGAKVPTSDLKACMKSALPTKAPHPALKFQLLIFSDLLSSTGKKVWTVKRL